MTAPTPTPTPPPSTPDPTLTALVLQLLRALLYVAGTLGVALPTVLTDQSVLYQVAGGVVLAGTGVWDLWQHFSAAQKAHAGARASARLGRAVRVASLLLAFGLAGFGLAACAGVTDINALLGGSAADTAIAYVAALDPTLSGYLTNADAVIGADAGTVLKVACGADSMANFVVATTETIDPKLIPQATQQSLAASFVAISAGPCGTAPPANVAQAAQEALALYAQLKAAWSGAGVTVVPAT